MKSTTKLWIGLGVLAIISPLGLIIPDHFMAGSAWGEWGSNEIRNLVGYVPAGLQRLGGFWNAPMAGYGVGGAGNGAARQALDYVVSAVVGVVLIAVVFWPIHRYLSRKGE